MKKIEVTVTYKYELEIDENHPVVKDYETENQMLLDCASYRFGSTLPVIALSGVIVKDSELIQIS